MLSRTWRAGILLLLIASVAGLAHDTEQDRLAAISANLHCLVCEGEPLYGSHAALAQDLRSEIRAMIAQGKGDHEIRETLLARYGDFLHDEVSPTPDALWWALGCVLFLAAGGLVVVLTRRLARYPRLVSNEQREHE